MGRLALARPLCFNATDANGSGYGCCMLSARCYALLMRDKNLLLLLLLSLA